MMCVVGEVRSLVFRQSLFSFCSSIISTLFIILLIVYILLQTTKAHKTCFIDIARKHVGNSDEFTEGRESCGCAGC